MAELSTRQRIALAEFLGSHFHKVRADVLNAEALAELTVGERLAVKFGGQVAAWLSLPKPSQRAAVSNKITFTAWVKEHMPAEVETVEMVRPGTQAAILAAAKANGGKWLNPETGEMVEIRGITFGTGDPSPRVELTEDAAGAIGTAWRNGEIDLSPMLALTGPEEAPAETPEPVPDVVVVAAEPVPPPMPLCPEPGSAGIGQVGKLRSLYQAKFGFKKAEAAQMPVVSGYLAGRGVADLRDLSEAEAAELLRTLDGIPDRAQLDLRMPRPAAAEGGES